ncbi:MAG: hypothetical protein K6B73_04665 [Treponema sp.]|nr:hypothetical protein [Treponema sp.]
MAFMDDIKHYVELGVNASKDALSRAGDAVTKFGDESVIRLEKKQFESKLRNEVLEIGYSVLKAFEEDNKETLTKDDEEIAVKIQNIKKYREEIAKREAILTGEENK